MRDYTDDWRLICSPEQPVARESAVHSRSIVLDAFTDEHGCPMIRYHCPVCGLTYAKDDPL